jgi:hypothetical protein
MAAPAPPHVRPRAQDKASYRLNLARWKGASDNQADVRFGSKADMCSAPIDVPFTPKSGRQCAISLRLEWRTELPVRECHQT